MAEPRSPAGRAAAAAARNPASPGAGPAPGAPIAGAPAPGAPAPEVGGPAVGATSAGTAVGATSASTDSANLAAGEADAARIADRRGPGDVLRTSSFAEAAAALVDRDVPLLDGGPGVGAARVAERVPERFVTRPIGTLGEELARAELREPRVPPVTKDVLPRSEFRVDPDTVPGHRYATAAAQLRRNGKTYQAGVGVRVDFRAYSQLVAVGAIVADPWHDLEVAVDLDGPERSSDDAPKV